MVGRNYARRIELFDLWQSKDDLAPIMGSFFDLYRVALEIDRLQG